MTYACNDLYHAIQGEGCQTGVPMALVRLQGCGVGCPFCDTKETWERSQAHRRPLLRDVLGTNPLWAEVDADTIAAEAIRQAPAAPWALVTGGEPADQDLGPLVVALHRHGFLAAVETSGTALGHVGAGFDWVCVSPKIDMPGRKPVLPEAVAAADEIKHVVGKRADIEALDRLLAAAPPKRGCQVCLQPMSGSASATRLCTDVCKERGWRLSVQVHKIIDER